MATTEQQLLEALQRQRQILNELARICSQIEQAIKGEHHHVTV